MQDLAKVKWMGRLLQKSAIEESLNRYYEMLDEAEKSFQVRVKESICDDDGLTPRRYRV